MKTPSNIIGFLTFILPFLSYSNPNPQPPKLQCAAHINSDKIELQETFPGFFIISIKDPYFEQFDVAVDGTSLPRLQVRVAKFSDDREIEILKKNSQTLAPDEKKEILSLLKPRIFDSQSALRPNGVATFSLQQGEDRISVHCGLF